MCRKGQKLPQELRVDVRNGGTGRILSFVNVRKQGFVPHGVMTQETAKKNEARLRDEERMKLAKLSTAELMRLADELRKMPSGRGHGPPYRPTRVKQRCPCSASHALNRLRAWALRLFVSEASLTVRYLVENIRPRVTAPE